MSFKQPSKPEHLGHLRGKRSPIVICPLSIVLCLAPAIAPVFGHPGQQWPPTPRAATLASWPATLHSHKLRPPPTATVANIPESSPPSPPRHQLRLPIASFPSPPASPKRQTQTSQMATVPPAPRKTKISPTTTAAESSLRAPKG